MTNQRAESCGLVAPKFEAECTVQDFTTPPSLFIQVHGLCHTPLLTNVFLCFGSLAPNCNRRTSRGKAGIVQGYEIQYTLEQLRDLLQPQAQSLFQAEVRCLILLAGQALAPLPRGANQQMSSHTVLHWILAGHDIASHLPHLHTSTRSSTTMLSRSFDLFLLGSRYLCLPFNSY